MNDLLPSIQTKKCRPKHILLRVRLESGPAEWQALQVNQAMAIHPEHGSVFFGSTFSISHVRTGLSIAKGFPSDDAAKACAEELRPLLNWDDLDAKNVRRVSRAIKEAIHAVVERHGGRAKRSK